MTAQITGVPSELEGYTSATAPTALNFGSAATAAATAIRAFNEANAGSDMPGTIDDVAAACDVEADTLLDHDRVPAAFAGALRALDANGVPAADGTYVIDGSMAAFVPFLVQARVDRFYASDDAVYETALETFDPGFAATYQTIAGQDPDARPATVWAEAVDDQARQDAAALEAFSSGMIDPESPAYTAIVERLEWVEQRSERLDGYADTLYIDELGAEGVQEFLSMVDAYAFYDVSVDGEVNGPDLHTDLIVPFATGFAVAAESPRADSMIKTLTDIDGDIAEARGLAMLMTGAPQPAEFLVPAADAILVDGQGYLDTRIGMAAIGGDEQDALLFGADLASLPDHLDVLVVEALAENVEASEQFAAMGEDQVEALVFYADQVGYEGDPDHVRYVEAATTVLDNAINVESNEEVLRTVVLVADGNVPDMMKDTLASIAAGNMDDLEGFVVASDEMRAEVQDFFGELSYSDTAVQILTLGAFDQYQAGMQEGIADFASLDPDQQAVTLNEVLESSTGDARVLLGTLGAGFDDADVSEEQRHAAMVGAVRWIGEGAARVGVASTPLTGGTGALVGVGAKGVAEITAAVFGGVTEPDETDGEEFVAAVQPEVEQLTAQLLYDDPEMRAFLVDAADTTADPDTISFDAFRQLVPVETTVDLQADAAHQGTLLYVLGNAYFR